MLPQQDYVARAAVDPLTRANAEALKRVLPQYLKKAAGLPFKDSQLLHDIRHTDLSALAREISPSHRSVNAADFAMAMTDAMTSILVEEWPVYSDRLKPFVRDLALENFRQQKIVTMTLPDFVENDSEDGVVDFGMPLLSSTTGKISTYEIRLKVSRQVWATNGAALSRAVSNVGYLMSRLELKLLAETLVSNPLLDDSQALFVAGLNSPASTPLTPSVAALESVVSALQSADAGALTGILASGSNYVAWRNVLWTSGFHEVAVMASPDLPAGHWYAFSNPQETPTVVRLKISGNTPAPQVGFQRIPKSDAHGYYSYYDCGFAGISRKGIFSGVSPE